MRTVPRARSRKIAETCCNASAAVGRMSDLSKSNRISAGNSMRVSVAVSLTASFLTWAPRSSTRYARYLTGYTRFSAEEVSATIWPDKSCAQTLPVPSRSDSRPAAALRHLARMPALPRDRNAIDRLELGDDHRNLFHVFRRGGELCPEIGLRTCRQAAELRTSAFTIGVAHHQI